MGFQRPPAWLRVYLDGVQQFDARVLEVERVLGGSRLNSASFVIEPTYRGRDALQFDNNKFVRDFALLGVVEITRIINPGEVEEVIHWGRPVAPSLKLQGDQVVYQSRLDDHLIGDSVDLFSAGYYNPVAGDWVVNHGSIVPADGIILNPIVDGSHRDNMLFNGLDWIVCDVESYPRDGTFALGAAPDTWDIPQVIMWACQKWLRPTIQMPFLADIVAVVGNNDFRLRNYVIRSGTTLSKLLDDLLHPFGYDWYVDFGARGGPKSLVFLSRGSGTGNRAMTQPTRVQANDIWEPADFALQWDSVDDAFNEVTVLGDNFEFEITVELVPGWKSDYDAIDGAETNLASQAIRDDPEKVWAWRKWVLNEAGDYAGYRKAGDPYHTEVSQPFNWGPIFGGVSHPKRRRFLPTITLDKETRNPLGTLARPHWQWWDGETWVDPEQDGYYGNITATFLRTECGIYFPEVSHAPFAHMILGLDVIKVRVTASVRSDDRLLTTVAAAQSFIAERRAKIIDAPRYKARLRLPGLQLPASIYHGDDKYFDSSVDDSVAATTYASEVLARQNRAILKGTLTLTGVDRPNLHPGQRVEGIAGRVNFQATPPALPAQYPVIVGVTFDVQGQKTILQLDTLR